MQNKNTSELTELGQSIWVDSISREMLDSGELKNLIETLSVQGLTSNPTIFEQAINKSETYDAQIRLLSQKGFTVEKIFEDIAVEDIARAADLLLPVYKATNYDDGFASIEVSPLLAYDTQGTIEEGIRLFTKLGRPNIMIKVPGTTQGLPAIKRLLEEGINVNITLLFSVENYTEVAKTYCEAIDYRVKNGLPVDKLRSVASFFVSRVDTAIDAKLQKIIDSKSPTPVSPRSLLSKFGIANCKLAYQKFNEIFSSGWFQDMEKKGAAKQRPLWASTSTKNPSLPDCIYVEELLGKNTVNTLPINTLKAFADHGKAQLTINNDFTEASLIKTQIEQLEIDISKELADLQMDGIKKFADSFRSLSESIRKKL